MLKTTKTTIFAILTTASLAIAGCGGGGSGGVMGTPSVPMQTCEDETRIPQTDICMRECPGGFQVPETQTCPANPPPVPMQTCDDNLQIPETADCGTEYPMNYGLENIEAAAAYSAGYFGQGVTVAVIDSGMLVTHEDLRDNVVEWRDFVYPERTTINDPSNHGTLVGGIIAAERNGIGGQGVAPLAKLIALKIGDDDGALTSSIGAIQHAVSANVKIVNHSYTANDIISYTDAEGAERYLVMPGGYLPLRSSATYSEPTAIFGNIKNADIVNVWSAGNQGWNSERGEVITCEKDEGASSCPNTPNDGSFNTLIGSLSSDSAGSLSINSGGSTLPYYLTGNYVEGMPSFQSIFPFYVADNNVRDSFLGEDGVFLTTTAPLNNELYSALLDDDNFAAMASRWLVVTALDSDNKIAIYSNGCGVAALWCISAPGSSIPGPSSADDSSYRTVGGGTSFSAPHASGALAVIHSVIPEMPINVAMAVLLTTATDLGEEGLDPIYGWGRINLSAAVTMAEGLRMANSGLSAVSYAELRQELPARFDYLPQRLQNVSVAIKITDNAYYNIGLADMLSTNGKAESSIGDGAAALLRPAATDSAPGFFAYGAHHSEIGLRYYGKLSGFSLMADMAHLAAETDFVGGDLGALGAIDSKSNTGKLQFLRTIGDNWQLFGGYEYAALRANAGGDGLISDIGNVHADGYNIGLALGDIWRFGDQFSLSAKRETALRDGELTLRYPHADGDFYRAFLGGEQDLQIRETTVSLRQKAATILMAGYRQPLDRQTEWATALEYNAANRAAAWSVKWQTRF